MDKLGQLLTFTDRSVAKIKEVMLEEQNPKLNLRIFVQGGGCAGFQYGFSLDDEINDDDFVYEKDGVKILVDSMSYQYLAGASVDYVEEVSGSQFVINNPNATSSCGCHQSFST